MTRPRADSEDLMFDSRKVQVCFLFQRAAISLGAQPRSYS